MSEHFCRHWVIVGARADRNVRAPVHGNGQNRVAVDDFVWPQTQGKLADSPLLGFGPQSLWDWLQNEHEDEHA